MREVFWPRAKNKDLENSLSIKQAGRGEGRSG